MKDTSFAQAYINKYISDNPTLKMVMLIPAYSTLKCQLPLTDQDEVNEHCAIYSWNISHQVEQRVDHQCGLQNTLQAEFGS